MLTFVPVSTSEAARNVQSNQTTLLQDSSNTEQEKITPVRRKRGRPRRSIPKEINCQRELLNNVPVETTYARSNFKSNDMLVRRKRGRPRKLVPKEINCQEDLLNTKPIEAMHARSSFKLKDMLVRRKRGRPRKLIPKEMKCQLTSLVTKPTEVVCDVPSFKQEEMLVFRRKGRKCRKRIKCTRTGEENGNEKGVGPQVNYQVGGTSEPSEIVKPNDNVWDEQVNHPIWSGSISVSHENFGVVDGLAAYMSSRGGTEIIDAVQLLPALLHAQVVSKLDVWPGFHDLPPTNDIIDLYILPANERNDVFDRFLDAITRKDVVLKAVYADVSVLIFSSLQLVYPYWQTMSGKYYLWAAFVGKNSFFPHSQEDNNSELNFGCDISFLYLTNEPQPTNEPEPVTENEEDRERIHGVNHDNTLLLQIESHPVGRAADSDLAEQETCEVNCRGSSPSAIRNSSTTNVPVDISESIGASMLEMANNFDDQSCGEETSSAYSVDPKYARILRAILDKHGDITRHCAIKSTKTLTCALERICASVQDLESMRFVNLRRSHLESMHSAIIDAELMKLDVKWLRDRYEEFVEAIEQLKAYKNMKDVRKEVDKSVAIKKMVISWKKDEILKLEGEIEKLEREVAEATQEKETLRCNIRNVSSKCKLWCQNSLIDGLV